MLGHDWEKAAGTIVESKITLRSKSPYGNDTRREYLVDVRPLDQPEAEPTMRVVVRDPHIMTSDWNPPRPGEAVILEVHSDGNVRFDKSDPRRSRSRASRLDKGHRRS